MVVAGSVPPLLRRRTGRPVKEAPQLRAERDGASLHQDVKERLEGGAIEVDLLQSTTHAVDGHLILKALQLRHLRSHPRAQLRLRHWVSTFGVGRRRAPPPPLDADAREHLLPRANHLVQVLHLRSRAPPSASHPFGRCRCHLAAAACRLPPPSLLQLDGCQDLLPGADDAAKVLHLRCRPPPAL
eukprot:scaffold79020_cov72-Phaeocystis_antarctica.AAC.4